MPESKKVKTKMEALEFCEEHQCKIEFRKALFGTPKHVIVNHGLVGEAIGRDLVEAVNRIIDLYHTPPIKHEELPW